MKFIDKLKRRLDALDSHLCIGLDSNYNLIPSKIKANKKVSQGIFDFNKNIIEATHKIAVAYKINLIFYESYGFEGLRGLRLTIKFLKKKFPEIPLLADCKRAEIGEGALMLKRLIFDWLEFDCIMITPWFGYDSIKDLITDTDHGFSVYVHDSNPSASDFQDLKLDNDQFLYQKVAEEIIGKWNQYGNVIVEVGATYPKQLKKVRQIVGKSMPILTAGVGVQGGKIEDLKGLFGENNRRLIVASSRKIIFAGIGKKNYFEEVRKAAEELRNKLFSV